MDAQPPIADPVVSLARQAIYRFAALSLLDPRRGCWEQLQPIRDDPLLLGAAELVRSLPEAATGKLAAGDRPLSDVDPGRVLACLPRRPKALNEQFEETFGLLVCNACPPHETEYIDSKFTFQRSNALADVSGFYRAFGLTPSRQHPERPDHIVQELEFMSVLIGLARQAAQEQGSAGDERVAVCREAQARFFREHLGWWAPAFARLLGREAAEGGYYHATAIFLAAWITAERSLLGLPAGPQPPAPSDIERPEECDGCVLSA